MAERMTLGALAKDLAEGRTSARKLVRECLDRIADPAGEGALAFLKVHSEQALAAASAYDQLREAGLAPSPYAGIPISVKDLFDLAGDVTTAGSVALKDATPALADAPAIARLKAAGFIVIGSLCFSGGTRGLSSTPWLRPPGPRHASWARSRLTKGGATSICTGHLSGTRREKARRKSLTP